MHKLGTLFTKAVHENETVWAVLKAFFGIEREENQKTKKRTGKITMFQAYTEQDHKKHDKYDLVPKGGTWEDVPGIEEGRAFSAEFLMKAMKKEKWEDVKKFLETKVWELSKDAKPADSSEELKKDPPRRMNPPIYTPL